MAHTARAIVIDDDPFSRDFLKDFLNEAFPEMIVDTRENPVADGDYDIFFLDNDFDGQPMAGTLARSIRDRTDKGLVIAFSGTLDNEILKDLLNAGCNGVCDKTNPGDLPTVMRVVREFVAELESQSTQGKGGILGAIRSISSLLSEWNRRLEDQEKDLDRG